MIDNRGNNADHLEKNVERLLTSTELRLPMPEEARVRILTELTESRGNVVRPWFKPRWTLAAAAALVAILIGLWPGGSPSGATWAAVIDCISEATTLRAQLDSELIAPDGEIERHRSRVYEQDPGLSRTEILGANGDTDWLIVLRRHSGGAEQLVLFPRERRAHRSAFVLRGQSERRWPSLNNVADSWKLLTKIASSDAERIGEEDVGGLQAVGFRIPAEEVFIDRLPSVTGGEVELWAHRDTATPLLLKLDFVDSSGLRTRAELKDIEWNVELAEQLFDLAVPMGWSCIESRRESVVFKSASLATHVTLLVGPESDDFLLSEDDLASVRGIDAVEDLNVDSPHSVSLTVELKPDAKRRVEQFLARHPSALLIADFNSEIRVVTTLDSERQLEIDLSRLFKTIEEIEAEYIATDDVMPGTVPASPHQEKETTR